MAKGVSTVKNIPLQATVREQRGSRKAQIIRLEGNIPGVVYGLGKGTIAITLPRSVTASVLHSGAQVVDLVLEGKSDKCLVKEVQYDYLQQEIEHIDLLRVDPKQKVRVKVPLEFRGKPIGAKDGGILETQLKEVELEVLAIEIPQSIRVPVDHLEMHQILHAKDIQIPSGARMITHPEAIVCQVRIVKEEVVAVAVEAGPTEPEVIGKKVEEGAEAAEGAAPAAAPGAKGAAPAAAAAPAAKKEK